MRHVSVRSLVVVAAIVAATFAGAATRVAAQTVETLPYDHIHLNVPDPAAAYAWYMKNIGGEDQPESANRIMYGTTRFMFLNSKDGQPSMGSAVDHIGFSFPNLEAKIKELEANGKTFQIFVYDGANHAFNNDTSAARYDKKAADLAWSRTVEFLKKNLA